MVSKLHNICRRPKNNFTNKLLHALLIAGATTLALSNPYAAGKLLRGIRKEISKEKIKNSFYYLRHRGLINYEERHGQASISLTKEGKKAAERYSFFNKEKISRPAEWDGKWRLVLFDIATEHRTKRNALRFFLKRLGFVQFQKSVWLLPFECEKEVANLKHFFDLSDDEVRLVVSDSLGNMEKYLSYFKLIKN